MTLRDPRAVALAALLCAAALGGCLGQEGKPPPDRAIKGHLLTIYSSLPTQGPAAGIARAVAAGERQALVDASFQAGPYRVRLIALSSSKPGTDAWDPGQVNENSNRAAHDPRAIAYLGELDLGASAVSVPVTNKAGILQISPGDGLASLTQRPPGHLAAGPERYYPAQRRSFLRLAPSDETQAGEIVERMKVLGVRRPALVVGSGIYARELAGEIAAKAQSAGIAPVEAKDLRDDPQSARDLPRQLAGDSPDAVVLALARAPNTATLVDGLARTLPQARLLTGSGVLVDTPLTTSIEAQLEAVAPQEPGGRAARRVLRRIARDQGAGTALPEALWGYEAMHVALDAIGRSERDGAPARRAEVIRAALAPRVRRSPMGTYQVHRSGTVTGLPLALYRLDDGRFAFVSGLP